MNTINAPLFVYYPLLDVVLLLQLVSVHTYNRSVVLGLITFLYYTIFHRICFYYSNVYLIKLRPTVLKILIELQMLRNYNIMILKYQMLILNPNVIKILNI
jgi:hypothetical protein